MQKFTVGSFQLETGKWVPAGMLFAAEDDNSVRMQEIEFPPENRFETEEEANDFFRKFYIKEGFSEKERNN